MSFLSTLEQETYKGTRWKSKYGDSWSIISPTYINISFYDNKTNENRDKVEYINQVHTGGLLTFIVMFVLSSNEHDNDR